jgi:hypothetical protein
VTTTEQPARGDVAHHRQHRQTDHRCQKNHPDGLRHLALLDRKFRTCHPRREGNHPTPFGSWGGRLPVFPLPSQA